MNLNQRSDEEVLASAVDDSAAFLLIFDRHFDRIAAYVARRATASRVEELTSEVFVRAFANRRRYDRTKAGVLPWLYGIATNVLRENSRQERRERKIVARMEAAARGAASASSTDGPSPLVPVIANALADLSDEEREPLLLYALGDLEYRQIAEALNVPLGTIKSRINRARDHLTRQLDRAGSPPRRAAKEGIPHG